MSNQLAQLDTLENKFVLPLIEYVKKTAYKKSFSTANEVRSVEIVYARLFQQYAEAHKELEVLFDSSSFDQDDQKQINKFKAIKALGAALIEQCKQVVEIKKQATAIDSISQKGLDVNHLVDIVNQIPTLILSSIELNLRSYVPEDKVELVATQIADQIGQKLKDELMVTVEQDVGLHSQPEELLAELAYLGQSLP